MLALPESKALLALPLKANAHTELEALGLPVPHGLWLAPPLAFLTCPHPRL